MATTKQQTDYLSRLPVDVLTDSLLPAIPTSDIIALARTCCQWYEFLTKPGEDSEIFWMRRCISDFNFPVRASGRRVGWFQLYKSLSESAAYVWGQNENGRLGLPDSTFRLETRLRSRLLEGGLVLPTRLELPAPPVSIAAGGWSFHALTADGKVMSWGTLNGGSWSRDDAPLHHDGRALKPSILPQCDELGPIKQLEAGRGHVIMLGQDGKVWEFRSFGRIVEVKDESLRWGYGATGAAPEVTSVHAGWDYSAVLSSRADVYVWWEQGSARLDRDARAHGEDSLTSPSTQGITFPRDIETLRLPPLPDADSSDEKIKLLACGDNFIIALTNHSRLYFLSLSPVPDPARPHARQGAVNDPEDSPVRSRDSMARLDAEFLSGRRNWRLMSNFCEREEIAKLGEFKDKPLAENLKITHVSAHFNSFAAYSVPSTSDSTESLVLLGNSDWYEQVKPKVIPKLQGLGVIKIAQGDYHNLALTSSGELYSWGSYSAGALGLGHPVLSHTPLSAPPSSQPEPSVVPDRRPQLNNPNQPLPAPTRQGNPMFPGFAAPRPVVNRPRAPDRVENPTRIKFHGETEENRTFVYAVTASGWHSGALAVNLDSSQGVTSAGGEEEPIIKLEKNSEEAERADQTLQAENEANRLGPTGGTWMGRLGRPFRVGLAAGRGRGANPGGAGGAVRPPSR
ncbi:uncharacterized protein JCM6883_006494 [Sporobolomyces salmoneus]|uniref:uncharacterized protein n=1 Tax=Sporobolomyces salmoneus TaxID=183962 RepID=UPI003172F5FF